VRASKTTQELKDLQLDPGLPYRGAYEERCQEAALIEARRQVRMNEGRESSGRRLRVQVKKLREERGLTQEGLAGLSVVSRPACCPELGTSRT
jgi:hypothetical protein